MINTLIPGIYTSYELSGVRYTGKAAGVAGVVWKGDSTESTASIFTSTAQIAAVYGKDCILTEIGGLLLKNGAMKIKAIQTANDYSYGFKLLMAETDVTVMLCDSTESSVHVDMCDAILDGGEDNKYRIGIVAAADSVEALQNGAEKLNTERMVLIPSVQCAAAFGGVVLGSADPSIPFNGAVLDGIDKEFVYTDTEINTLLSGGVTAVRTIGGKCEIVRAVTTKTTTAGVPDSTWRDLNTILVTDYVIPKIKTVLRTMFTRAKNTDRTRGAVRTQVVIELDKMLDSGIIENYGNVTVKKSAEDPSICEVGFEFTVPGGMHQIIIAAGIII